MIAEWPRDYRLRSNRTSLPKSCTRPARSSRGPSFNQWLRTACSHHSTRRVSLPRARCHASAPSPRGRPGGSGSHSQEGHRGAHDGGLDLRLRGCPREAFASRGRQTPYIELAFGRGCILHEVRLGQLDVVSIGGLLVTSPLRTAVDVALHVEASRALPHCGCCCPGMNWASGCGS